MSFFSKSYYDPGSIGGVEREWRCRRDIVCFLGMTSNSGSFMGKDHHSRLGDRIASRASGGGSKHFSVLRSDNSGEEPPWHGGGIGFPLLVEQLVHLFVLRISPADPHAERPEPPDGPHDESHALVSQQPAFRHPASSC